LLSTRPEIGILATRNLGIQPLPKEWSSDMIDAHRKGEIVRLDNHNISIPITLRGQVLGVVRLQKNINQAGWTDNEISLMEVLIDQLENALESARLYNDTQRSAARERLVTEITTKIRSSNDPDTMLQTAIVELQNALRANKVQIHVPPRD
jgi:GAF domain-containing protein